MTALRVWIEDAPSAVKLLPPFHLPVVFVTLLRPHLHTHTLSTSTAKLSSPNLDSLHCDLCALTKYERVLWQRSKLAARSSLWRKSNALTPKPGERKEIAFTRRGDKCLILIMYRKRQNDRLKARTCLSFHGSFRIVGQALQKLATQPHEFNRPSNCLCELCSLTINCVRCL